MPKNSLNVSLKGADDIFSTEESRQEQQREQVQQIPIGELFPFKDHPLTPMQTTPRTRATSRFPPRTSRRNPVRKIPNPSDFKAAFAALHI